MKEIIKVFALINSLTDLITRVGDAPFGVKLLRENSLVLQCVNGCTILLQRDANEKNTDVKAYYVTKSFANEKYELSHYYKDLIIDNYDKTKAINGLINNPCYASIEPVFKTEDGLYKGMKISENFMNNTVKRMYMNIISGRLYELKPSGEIRECCGSNKGGKRQTWRPNFFAYDNAPEIGYPAYFLKYNILYALLSGMKLEDFGMNINCTEYITNNVVDHIDRNPSGINGNRCTNLQLVPSYINNTLTSIRKTLEAEKALSLRRVYGAVGVYEIAKVIFNFFNIDSGIDAINYIAEILKEIEEAPADNNGYMPDDLDAVMNEIIKTI